jgi:hypothetical protein
VTAKPLDATFYGQHGAAQAQDATFIPQDATFIPQDVSAQT